jgi:DNA polymerase III gamma/tau subunit
MNALAKLGDYSEAAFAAVVNPLVVKLEAKQREDEAAAAAKAYVEAEKLPDVTPEMKKASLQLAKAKADEAARAADYEKAKAERLQAEVTVWGLSESHGRVLQHARRAAYAQHVKTEAHRRVTDLIGRIRGGKDRGLDRPLRALCRLQQTVAAISAGDEAPPAPDLLSWLDQKLDQITADIERARAEFVAAQNGSERDALTSPSAALTA